jgi:hypothetical protein
MADLNGRPWSEIERQIFQDHGSFLPFSNRPRPVTMAQSMTRLIRGRQALSHQLGETIYSSELIQIQRLQTGNISFREAEFFCKISLDVAVIAVDHFKQLRQMRGTFRSEERFRFRPASLF